MKSKIYKEIERTLTSKEKFYIKLGLDRIKVVLESLANPHLDFKTIHVAGTNGKGSTSSIIAKLLEFSGYKTGLFTSPHLIKYNERIKISSKDISDEDFLRLLGRVDIASKNSGTVLTEFEILVVVAFLYFSSQKVDIAVIEVGLGGRLDATNVINSVLSVISSIGLDHTKRLGNSIEEIAFEKAGIIKQNSSVVVSLANKGIGVIRDESNKKNAKLIFSDEVQRIKFQEGINNITIANNSYELSLPGDFQGENLALALKTKEQLELMGFEFEHVENALRNVCWKARFQFLDKKIILDGAHNPQAASKLRSNLDKYYPEQKITWFFGGLNNKDYKKISKILFKEKDDVYFLEFNHQGSLAFEDFKEQFGSVRGSLNIEDFVADYKEIKKTHELVVIAGSLYMAGDVLALMDNKGLPG